MRDQRRNGEGERVTFFIGCSKMKKFVFSAAVVGAMLAGAVKGADAPAEGNQGGVAAAPVSGTSKPNIVYILCDDLGIGDVHAFNLTRGKIKTPNFNLLATQGM